jgi:hypothetical protein
LINGDEKRNSALDIISAMGLVGGVVMAGRAAAHSLSNKSFELPPVVAARLFEAKQMVWCRKCDAEIWRYLEKPWMLVVRNTGEQIYCPFNSLTGTIHCCMVLYCRVGTQRSASLAPSWQGLDKDLLRLGFSIRVVKQHLAENELEKAMDASILELPD